MNEPQPFPTPPPSDYPADPTTRRAHARRDARVWALTLTIAEVRVLRGDRGAAQGTEPETPAAARLLGRLWRRLSDRGLSVHEVATMRDELLRDVAAGIRDP